MTRIAMGNDDDRLAAMLDLFESEWRRGDPPHLDDFLPDTSATIDENSRRAILTRFILIDIEQRWRRCTEALDNSSDVGETVVRRSAGARIEEYVARYPDLFSLDNVPLEVICQEYRARHQWGDKPSEVEYFQRFPEQAFQLAPRLAAVKEGLQLSLAVKVPGGTQARSDVSNNTSPMQVGDFELLAEIARGGMGVVYRARQISLNRIVALKMIKSGNLAGGEEVQRFYLEAKAAAKLDHAAIIPVYEVGQVNGQHYYAMGLVEGQSLAQRINEGPLAPRQAAALLFVVAEAMHYAHSQGVIHRDLKPANILLVGRGTDSQTKDSPSRTRSFPSSLRAIGDKSEEILPFYPRITDFGLAKHTHATNDITSTGQILGTPSYMPPEQARGDSEIGPAADIYSLGAVLFAMLTGRPPFQAANVIDTVQQVLNQEPLSPRRLNPMIDRDIETICLKCLQKSPVQRYSTALALSDDLRRYLNDEPILARPVGATHRLWRWCRRKPALAGLLLSAGVTLLAGVALLVIGSQLSAAREREQASREREKADKMRLLAADDLAQAHELQLKATQQVADTQRYYALLNGVRKRIAEHTLGWAVSSLDDLAQAASMSVASDSAEMRNEAARCLSGIDLRKRKEFPTLPGYRSHSLAFDPTGTRLATAVLKHAALLIVDVYEVPSGKSVHTLTTASDFGWQFRNRNQDGIEAVSFVAKGTALAIVTRSGWVQRWDLTTSPPTQTSYRWPATGLRPENVSAFVFDPNGDRLWAACDEGLIAWSYREATATEPATWKSSGGRVRTIAITPDGRRIAAGFPDDLRVYDAANPRLIRRIPTSVGRCCIDQAGRLAGVFSSGTVKLFDIDTGTLMRTISDPQSDVLHGGGFLKMALSPSGSLLVTGGSDSRIMLWDTVTGRYLLSDFIGGTDAVVPAFSPDERYLATTGNERVTLYELNGPNILQSIAIQATPVRALDVAADVPILVTAAMAQDSRCISIWDLESGSRRDGWEVVGGDSPDSMVSLSRDGRRLATNDPLSGHLYVWELDPTSRNVTENAAEARALADSPSVFAWYDDKFLRIARNWSEADATPRPSASLAELGVGWNGVDAALRWSDDRLYLFQGDECHAIETATGRSLDGFPQKIAAHFPGLWQGGINAAMRLNGDAAGFFRGDEWIRVNVSSRRADEGFPRKIAEDWPGVFESDIDFALDYSEADGSVWFFQKGQGRQFNVHSARTSGATVPLTDLFGEALGSLPITAMVDTHPAVNPRRMIRQWLHFKASEPIAIGLRRDGATIIVGEQGKELVARSTADASVRWQWSNNVQKALLGVSGFPCLSLGNEWIAAGTAELVRLFRIEDGQPGPNIVVGERVGSVSLAHDDSLVAIGTNDGTVVLATVPLGTILTRDQAHHDRITSIAFSPTDEMLATASNDRTIVLWQRRGTEQEYNPSLTLHSPFGAVRLIRFTPDGSRLLASVQGETGLRVWRLDRLRNELRARNLDW